MDYYCKLFYFAKQGLLFWILQRNKIPAKEIGIISPYRRQVQKIREQLYSRGQEFKEITVGSTEEFQVDTDILHESKSGINKNWIKYKMEEHSLSFHHITFGNFMSRLCLTFFLYPRARREGWSSFPVFAPRFSTSTLITSTSSAFWRAARGRETHALKTANILFLEIIPGEY